MFNLIKSVEIYLVKFLKNDIYYITYFLYKTLRQKLLFTLILFRNLRRKRHKKT